MSTFRWDIPGANLHGANLTGANLSGANFASANLTDAKLLNLFADEHTVWPADFEPK